MSIIHIGSRDIWLIWNLYKFGSRYISLIWKRKFVYVWAIGSRYLWLIGKRYRYVYILDGISNFYLKNNNIYTFFGEYGELYTKLQGAF